MSTPNLDPQAIPEGAADLPKDLAVLSDLANSLFSALPGAAGPQFGAPIPQATVPMTSVQQGLPGTAAGLADPADAVAGLPHYTTAPTFDSPVKPHSPALGGYGRPLGPPQGLTIPVLGLDIPCDGSRLPIGAPGAVPSGGFPQATAPESFYFLTPQVATPAAPVETIGLPVAGASGFDAKLYRKDFPILSETVNGKPLVWLDNGATTQKPRAVIDRLSYFYEHENSNIHRAAHELAARATDAYEAARESVRRFLNAPSTDNIVFARGTTEAINLVAQSWGRANLGPGDEVVISHLEHHANIVPWVRLAEELGFKLKVAPVNDKGEILIDEYARLLTEKVKLVSFTHVSNALGTVTPARLMIDMAHRVGAITLLDGAQSVSHMPVDVQALDTDLFVFSGHKVFGPTGIGALYGKSDVLDAMPPWQGGGNMIEDVTFEHIRYNPAPWKFEAGTGNIADAVGLGAALDYVMRIGMDAISAHEHDLLVYGTHLLTDIKGVKIIGQAADKAGVISFVMDNHTVPEIGKALSAEGIAVRAGHHCAQPILRRMGLEATVRPSLAFYNTFEDLDALAKVVRRLSLQK
ncbi:family 2A encapsulin nanocompartment cargo protein cysteine desulfurase [Asticcacaulis sp. AC460]|uniref:family 2A encapsulin nanocompartment cargo protein cysteine desulfurase n=1 Tax=Asticcacaulis sp. AC460 TaxID=1282360 RepID=UPI00190FBB6F|nr:family 2A encapsulin nanocompartment cargo protein cysteine desulfurase [Asticcacaulis sp. AC460]